MWFLKAQKGGQNYYYLPLFSGTLLLGELSHAIIRLYVEQDKKSIAGELKWKHGQRMAIVTDNNEGNSNEKHAIFWVAAALARERRAGQPYTRVTQRGVSGGRAAELPSHGFRTLPDPAPCGSLTGWGSGGKAAS